MAPKSMTTSSPGSMRRSDGLAWGRAPFGPLATIDSKATASAPRRRISKSSAMAKSRSVGGLAQELFHLRQGDVGDVGRLLDTGQLALVFHGAQRLDRTRHRHELGRATEAPAEALLGAPGDVVGLEAETLQCLGHLLDGRELGRRPADLDPYRALRTP